MERHGSQTSLQAQYGRAAHGINPTTGAAQRTPSAATRFTSHRDHLNAMQKAQSVYNRGGADDRGGVTVPFNRVIGEGYRKNSLEYGTSNTAKVVFDNQGNPITAFPIWGQ